ncbi:hypothetical protein DPM19_28275 [Actinomadura craniellae]|uniref:Uncharacterized protein n=1 Tax=Actinomadura craniellae TaxID=2231787 RepID=A0A365GYI5_9ACTN|nr:hypothetical protein [Actinomadura craniellae]RAY11872.1 hypothetical protein DPM19_28275 [Actinomadura craniellae]
MSRDGYVARWRGVDYEASPGADGTVRLYSAEPAEGFEEVRPGRHRRLIPPDEVESLRYLRTTCTWQGEQFTVVGEHDTWLRVEYLGGRAPVAERLELEHVDHGVWQAWAPQSEVQNLREEFI